MAIEDAGGLESPSTVLYYRYGTKILFGHSCIELANTRCVGASIHGSDLNQYAFCCLQRTGEYGGSRTRVTLSTRGVRVYHSARDGYSDPEQ
mgnify:CR=1 FL=1